MRQTKKNKKNKNSKKNKKIYKGGFYYNTCDITEDNYQEMIKNKNWQQLQKEYNTCCPNSTVTIRGKVRGVPNQTKKCKVMQQRVEELWTEQNNDADESHEDDVIVTQPVDRNARPITSSNNSMCNIL